MRNYLLNISLLLLLLAAWLPSGANGFSYIYIQGDKQAPFYIKFEDQMLPRYGKNYNIIPQLAPGPVNIQVLFQQNMYPAQRFTIMVPEDGFRGFLLLQKNGSFALYDIHQQFYLYPGNRAEDDRVPQANSYVYTTTAATAQQAVPAATDSRPRATDRNSREPRFMSNIELNNERTVQNTRPAQRMAEEQRDNADTGSEPGSSIEDDRYEPAYTAPTESAPPAGTYVTNSDCPSAMTDEEFEDLYSKSQAKAEKQKLRFLLAKMDLCFSTNQARMLAETLNNDPERYTFLKRVFPRVTDQYNFPPLENLLSTQEWRSYFRLILPK
ncbi:MAG TPA: DUF4476 domain-containing protein [Flavipsychrobacter sp.]